MKKLMVSLAMVLVLSLLVVPVYAAESASDTVTVNITVAPWIEIKLIDPNPIDLEVNSSEIVKGSVDITVLSNTSWRLGAHPNWGNYFGRIGLENGSWSAPGHQPVAIRTSNSKTSVDGENVEMGIELHPRNMNNELLGPDDDGSFVIDLIAQVK